LRFFLVLFKNKIIFRSENGIWLRLFPPPVEGKLIRGVEGLYVGDRVRVELIGADVERRSIDFARQGEGRGRDL